MAVVSIPLVSKAPSPIPMPTMHHCVLKISEIVDRGEPDRRSLLQIGYNLGRLSELTGLGRAPFWDRWKGAVEAWDRPELARLARELVDDSASWAIAGVAEEASGR